MSCDVILATRSLGPGAKYYCLYTEGGILGIRRKMKPDHDGDIT